jgi:hypothetical protein
MADAQRGLPAKLVEAMALAEKSLAESGTPVRGRCRAAAAAALSAGDLQRGDCALAAPLRAACRTPRGRARAARARSGV